MPQTDLATFVFAAVTTFIFFYIGYLVISVTIAPFVVDTAKAEARLVAASVKLTEKARNCHSVTANYPNLYLRA